MGVVLGKEQSNKFGSIRIKWISKIISCIVCVYLYEQNDFNLKRHLQFYALKNTCHKHHIIVKFSLFFFFYFFSHQLLNCAYSFVILFLRIFFSIRSLFLNCTRHKHFLCYSSWDNWMDTICKKEPSICSCSFQWLCSENQLQTVQPI